MTIQHSLFASLVLAGSLLPGSAARGAPIIGQANISGTVTVSTSGVAFQTQQGANLFNAENLNTGSFAGLTGGSIQNLTGPAMTGSLNIPDFLAFQTAGGPVYFDLANISAGFGTAAGCTDTVGSVCTPNGSPFTLIQRPSNQVEIDLSVSGTAYTGSASTGTTPVFALFTTQNLMPGQITAIVNAAATTQGFTDSYSASFASAPAATPEPASLAMMGAGLFGVGLFARRSMRQQ